MWWFILGVLLVGLMVSLLYIYRLRLLATLKLELATAIEAEKISVDRIQELEHNIINKEMEKRNEENTAPTDANSVLERLHTSFNSKNKTTTPMSSKRVSKRANFKWGGGLHG